MPHENINDHESAYHRVKVVWSEGEPYVAVASVWWDESTDYKWDGTCVRMDRDGVNRMIKALRRGRDRVFGKDA